MGSIYQQPLSLLQKVFVVKQFYRYNENLSRVKNEFEEKFDIKPAENSFYEIFQQIINLFENTGSVTTAVFVDCEDPHADSEINQLDDLLEVTEEVFIKNVDFEMLKESTTDEIDEKPALSSNQFKENNQDLDDSDPIKEKTIVIDKPVQYKTKKKDSPKTKDKFTCIVCNKNYSVDYQKSHYRKHDREGTVYDCGTCDEKFENYFALQIHEESHIPPEEYQFQCKSGLCQEKFVSQEKLDLHQKDHLQKKTFICEWCGMIFAKQESLRVHIRTHTGEKPLQCKICDASFAFYGSLKAHMKIHSEGSFKCNYCDKMFVYSSARNMHHREHTGNKPFVCHICNRACATPHNLRSHMKILHKIQMTLDQIKEHNFVMQEVQTQQ